MSTKPLFKESSIDDALFSELNQKANNYFRNAVSEISLYTKDAEEGGRNPKIGIEIELERVGIRNISNHNGVDYLDGNKGVVLDDFPFTKYFMVTKDGSLRNGGAEFISRLGLSLPTVLKATKELLTFYPDSGIFKRIPEATYRTSVHVHYNGLNKRVKQLKLILFWYMMLEPLFFKHSGQRNTNIFTVPVTTATLLNTGSGLLTASTRLEVLSGFGDWQKYSALNLQPLYSTTGGSIEFRHHRGTIDYEEIKSWINLIDAFINTVEYLNLNSVQKCYDYVLKWVERRDISPVVGLFGSVFRNLNKEDHQILTHHMQYVLNGMVKALITLNDDDIFDEDLNKPKRNKNKERKFNPIDDVAQSHNEWINALPDNF